MNRTILIMLFSCLFCLVAIVSCKTRFDSKPLISGGGQGRHEQQLGKSAALLLIKDDPKQPNGVRFCSAVAVSPIHILTAAHCLFKHERVKNFFFPGSRFSATRQELDPKAVGVFFTERLDYTFKDSPNSGKAARREVKSIWINEDYRLSQKPIDTGLELTWGNWVLFPKMNDIALLTLTKRIPEPLVPADLPEQDATIEVADSKFVMTGYGAQGVLPAVSKIGDLQFFSFRSFEDPKVPFNIVYRPKKNLFAFDSHQSAIPCYGDSGGPLFRSNTEADSLELVAVFSASISGGGLCLSKGLTYTTVASFTDVLRCRSGSSLASSSGWVLTKPQRERCTALKIKPPQIAASRFTESVESIGGPVAKSSKANQLVYFDASLVPECDREKIRTAYRELSRKYHPDLVTDPEAKIQATAIQKDVNAEHDYLKKLCGL